MRSLLLCLSVLALAGCPNTDAAVFVEPTVTAPVLAVQTETLGAFLQGSFTLELHLGPRASGPSQVTLGSLSITDAQQKETLVPSLSATPEPAFPVTVELDGDVDVAFTLDTGDPVPADLRDKLCDPAGVVIAGTIQDSLQNRATPFSSAVIQVTCAP